jgi:hypothetical protein
MKSLAIQEDFVTVSVLLLTLYAQILPLPGYLQFSFQFLICVFSTCSEAGQFVGHTNNAGCCKHPEFSPCKIYSSSEQELGILN